MVIFSFPNMNSSVLFVLFISHVCLKDAFCANILIAYDVLSPSHQLWNYALAEGLMERGHNITMIGPFSNREKKSDAYHSLMFEGPFDAVIANSDFNIEDSLANSDPITSMRLTFNLFYTICNHSYTTHGFKALMNYPKDFKFDAIIIDVTTGSCLYPLIQRFNYPPTVGVTAFLLPPYLSNTFGNDIHPAYLPFYRLQYTDDMGFLQRVVNYALMRIDIIYKEWYEIKMLEKLARQTFGENMDAMESLERHISMLLCNINYALHYPRPLAPNIIPVGGLHVKEAKSLPEDLQIIMDNAKDGVILFSLGTNIRSDNLKIPVREALLDGFGKLQQTIIWKFESQLENVPKNVIIRKWLPQNDMLGHPNLRVFISHGGALSTLEAAYHGIPIIGMPFFIDQLLIVDSMVAKKVALKVDFHNMTSQILQDCINEILKSPQYSRNMREVSRRMRDQPQTPLETAVFWVEYAMRHNGAKFLNPKSRDLPIFISSSADVILFLLFVTFSLVCVVYVIIRKMRSYLSFMWKKKQKLN